MATETEGIKQRYKARNCQKYQEKETKSRKETEGKNPRERERGGDKEGDKTDRKGDTGENIDGKREWGRPTEET